MKVFGYLVLVFILIFASTVGVWLIRVQFSDEIGRGNAEIQINSAENRISQYEYFFDLCQSVQTAEDTIDTYANLAENTENSDLQDKYEQVVAQNQVVRQSGINKYNSEATQRYTSQRFLASNLPWQLDTTPYEPGGVHTTCAAP